MATILFAGLSINLFNGSLSVYLARDRGFSLELVGLLVGVAFVPQLIAPLLAGPLVDRRGPQLAIRLGAVSFLVAAILFLLTTGGFGIGVARLLQGLGFALVVPASYTLVSQVVPERHHGTALGGFGAFLNVSLAIGPPIGLWLLQQGPEALFAVAAVAALVAVAASWLLGGSPAPAPAPRDRLFTYRRRWTPLLAVTFLTVIYFGVILAYLPVSVPRSQVSAVGWFFTADAVVVLACRAPAGYLTDRFGPRWLLLIGIVLTAASVLLLLLPPSLPVLVVCGIGTGAGAALLLPPILVELGKRSDESDRGTAMALYTTSFAAAIGVGSLAAAPVVGRFGFGATLVLSTVACLAAAPIVLGSMGPDRAT